MAIFYYIVILSSYEMISDFSKEETYAFECAIDLCIRSIHHMIRTVRPQEHECLQPLRCNGRDAYILLQTVQIANMIPELMHYDSHLTLHDSGDVNQTSFE